MKRNVQTKYQTRIFAKGVDSTIPSGALMKDVFQNVLAKATLIGSEWVILVLVLLIALLVRYIMLSTMILLIETMKKAPAFLLGFVVVRLF